MTAFFAENRLVFKLSSSPEGTLEATKIPEKIKGSSEIQTVLSSHPELIRLLTEKFPKADEIKIIHHSYDKGENHEIQISIWNQKTRQRIVYAATESNIEDGIKWASEFKKAEAIIPADTIPQKPRLASPATQLFFEQHPSLECQVYNRFPEAQTIQVYAAKSETATGQSNPAWLGQDNHVGFVMIATFPNQKPKNFFGFDDNGNERKALAMLEHSLMFPQASSPKKNKPSPNTNDIKAAEEEIKKIAKDIFHSDDLLFNRFVLFINKYVWSHEGFFEGQKICFSPEVAVERMIRGIIALFNVQTYIDMGSFFKQMALNKQSRTALGSLVKIGWENCSNEEKMAFVTSLVFSLLIGLGTLKYLESSGRIAQFSGILQSLKAEKLAHLSTAIIASPIDDLFILGGATAPQINKTSHNIKQAGLH